MSIGDHGWGTAVLLAYIRSSYPINGIFAPSRKVKL